MRRGCGADVASVPAPGAVQGVAGGVRLPLANCRPMRHPLRLRRRLDSFHTGSGADPALHARRGGPGRGESPPNGDASPRRVRRRALPLQRIEGGELWRWRHEDRGILRTGLRRGGDDARRRGRQRRVGRPPFVRTPLGPADGADVAVMGRGAASSACSRVAFFAAKERTQRERCVHLARVLGSFAGNVTFRARRWHSPARVDDANDAERRDVRGSLEVPLLARASTASVATHCALRFAVKWALESWRADCLHSRWGAPPGAKKS
jgi:hypothetical protein